MVNAWKATQSDQEVLCESLIQCLHETPNEQGQGVPKPEFNELIACLEKFCTNQGDCAQFTFFSYFNYWFYTQTSKTVLFTNI